MGQPWTCADVERWLVTGYRTMRYTAVFAPRGNTLRAVDANLPDATFDILAFACTVLDSKSAECRALLFWARTKADGAPAGDSIAEFCRQAGWKRRTFDRRRKRACQKVAVAKNRADRGKSHA